MDPEEKTVGWKEYFIELLNSDIPDIPTRRENQFGAEPMIHEVTQE